MSRTDFLRVLKNARLALVAVLAMAALGARANLVQTNRTERWVTNLVEVKMQATKLITEYRTNWNQEIWNNIIDVYATNRVTKQYTNKITVELLQTNYVKAYRTNLQTLQLTNWATVALYRTNYITRHLTNRINVDEFRTNLVQAYQTNVKTLHLTNWVTVLLFKTNWVNQPLTNVVSIDLPRQASRPSASAPGAVSGEVLAIQAHRGSQPATGKPAEVQLTVHSNAGTDRTIQVQQWRVEREDGSMLLFGQDQVFRRALPVGKYKVEVKARQPGTNHLLAALGTLSVLPGDVLLQQKPSPAWVSP